ncbi:MAG: hypothetical protein H6Q74_267 [Firmicutes bacterium]|nr:hypothetical protein [Bacillota bacterium]
MSAVEKVFVEVTAKHDKEGKVRPLSISWEDGRELKIDRVIDVRRTASLKAGGLGIRYTCKILGRAVYLFDDEGRWFIEM